MSVAAPPPVRPVFRRPGSIGIVAAGGMIGTGLRMAATRLTPTGQWPWSIFTVNLVGALVLGWLTEALIRSSLRRRGELRLLLGTGLCGGLTTYSTLAVDVARILPARPLAALSYLATSLMLGVALAAAGFWLGGRRRA